jgi:cytochrome oxidase Cu insertion factor (SCO1/SenC/PrrC family)
MRCGSVTRGVALAGAAAAAFTLAAARTAASEPPAVTTVKVGDHAPGFALAGSDGRTYRLTDLRDKKRLVLVVFRGTW